MKLKWGIIGFGKIARDFVADLQLSNRHALTAIATRSEAKKEALQKEFQSVTVYSSYQSILTDSTIDIIYIATPHDSHMLWSIEGMNQGKHVLCEKPVGINYYQVEQMVQCARKNQVFFMEALWTRFNPSIEAMLSCIEKQEIGKIRYIQGDFCFYKAYDPESRLFHLDRAGGALLDIGIYPIFLSYLLLGMPVSLESQSILHESGIDLQSSGHLRYQEASAQFLCSTLIPSKCDAFILGEQGYIQIESRWHETDAFLLFKEDQCTRYEHQRIGRGFYYEIEECYRCIHDQKIESSKWSHQNSLDLMQILDSIRSQNQIVYPMDKES